MERDLATKTRRGTPEREEERLVERRTTPLDQPAIHDVLRNERRTMVLAELRRRGTTTLRELSELVASTESGETPPPRNARDSAYASLHQTHLPMLDRNGIVEYDRQSKHVVLGPRARDLDPYLNVTTTAGRAWQSLYVAFGIVAILTLAAASAGLPVVSLVPTTVWAVSFVAGYAVGLVAQYGWRDVVRRLRNAMGAGRRR